MPQNDPLGALIDSLPPAVAAQPHGDALSDLIDSLPTAPPKPIAPAIPPDAVSGPVVNGQHVAETVPPVGNRPITPAIPDDAHSGPVGEQHVLPFAAPGAAAPPLPEQLKSDQQVASEATERIDPRTGFRYKQMPFGTRPVFDFPANVYTHGKEGVEALAHPVEAFVKEEGRQEAQGSGIPVGPTNLYPGIGLDAARGTTKLVQAGLEAATPLAVAGGITAPLETAATIGLGMVAGKGAQAGLRQAGVAPEYAELGGDLVGLAAGATIGGWTKLFDKIDAHNEIAAQALQEEQAAGTATAQTQDIAGRVTGGSGQDETDITVRRPRSAQPITLDEGIHVNIDDVPHTIKPLDVNFDPTSVQRSRRPMYGVYNDETGVLVNAGTGDQVGQFLGKNGAVPANAVPTRADLDARYSEMTAERAEAQSAVDRRGFLQNASPERLQAERAKLAKIVADQDLNIYGRPVAEGGYQFKQEEITSPERHELKLIDQHLATGKPIPSDLPAEEILKDASKKLSGIQKQRAKMGAEGTQLPQGERAPTPIEPPAPASPELDPEPSPAPPVKPSQVKAVSPATPNPPTAALPTTPEKPETIAAQLTQLGTFGAPVQPDQRKAVMFPGGQGMPTVFPEGTRIHNDGLGNIYVYRPDLIEPGEISRAAKTNKLSEVLGGPMGMGAPDKAELKGPPVAVVARAQATPEATQSSLENLGLAGGWHLRGEFDKAAAALWKAATLDPAIKSDPEFERLRFDLKNRGINYAHERFNDGTTKPPAEVQSTVTDAENLPVTHAATQMVTPPGGTVSVEPAEKVVAERQGLEHIGDMGGAIADNMYGMLWDKVQKGITTEAGGPSALLQGAKAIRDRGGLQTPEEFRTYANEYAGIPRGDGFQQAMRALVAKYSPPRPATPQLPTGVAGATPLGVPSRESWQMPRDEYVGSGETPGSSTSRLSARELTNLSKGLGITGYETKTVAGRNKLARAIAHKSMVKRAIERGEAVSADVLADYPDLRAAIPAPPPGFDLEKPPTSALDEMLDSMPPAGITPEGELEEGERRVTGSADIPLTEDGTEQIADLTKKAVKPFDYILHGPSTRATESAEIFAPTSPNAPVPLESLGAWKRATSEGKPADEVKAEVAHLIMNPDVIPPGVSPISGEPGESWNTMAHRMFGDLVDIMGEWRDGERILLVTSGGNMQAIDAWGKAEYPTDFEFDHSGLAAQPYWSVTGKMFRLSDKGLEQVESNEKPGIYIVEHGETAWNSKGEAASEQKPTSINDQLIGAINLDDKTDAEIDTIAGILGIGKKPVPAEQPPTEVTSNREPEPATTEPAAAPEPAPVQRPGQEDTRPLAAGEAEVPAEPAAAGTPSGSGVSSSGGAREPVQPGEASGTRGGPGGRSGTGAVEPSGRTPGGRVTGDLTRQTEGGDFRISPSDHIGEGTLRAKLKDNLEAIRTIKKIEGDGRPATPEEQEILAKYVGWGAMSQIFDWQNRDWAGARTELNSLLTPEEYKAASASTKNAHFTSPVAIASMWDAMQRFGLQAGSRVLEPSMGIGSFFGMQPDFLMPSQRTGVELDKITGAMAKALYPDSNVQVTGFEKMSLPKDFFDIAIGNVPFGNYPVYDPQYKRNPIATRSIHNYFFLKSLDLVRPGGIVGYITSRYTMDAQDSALRAALASKANLLGMMRLPNKAFKENAGTQVVTDMIFFQKRAEGEAQSGPEFRNIVEVTTPDGDKTNINEYYVAHPEMLLGKLTMKGSMYGSEPSQDLGGSLTPEILSEAVGRLPQNVYSEWAAHTPALDNAGNDYVQLGDRVKDGGYDIKDGVVVQREGSIYKPAIVNDKTGPRIRAMIPVRNALYDVLETQLSNAPDEAIVAARDRLNKTYDAFVKVHGALNNPANARALGDDPDYVPMSGALEDYDRETKQAKKTEIFDKRTVERQRFPDHAETANEALALTLNELGRLDWSRMQELTGKTPDELLEELGNQVFQNPDGRKWETQDEYLSGNVRKKLDMAETAANIDPAFRRNVEALKAVQPTDLRPDEIKITPGAPWIPAGTVQDFVREVLNLRSAAVHYAPAAATWSIDIAKNNKDTVANKETWGASKYYGHQLLDLALNGKSPRVYQDGPNDTRIFDPEATSVAQAGMDALKDKFREWIWQDSGRATTLAAKYNKEVNNLRLTDHDGSFLTLPGSNPAIALRPHQKNGIWRSLKTGNTLLAHEVGAGKTWTMVGIAMESRRLGVAKKPMIAVPNHMAEQFSKEFLQLYPAAKILTIGKEDFAKENRTRAVARIAAGNWDAVIIRHSSFGKIPVSDETYQAFVDNQVAELKAALAEQLVETGYKPGKDGKEGKKDKTVKEIEKAIARLEVKLQKHLAREDKDTGLTFEQLGVDMLMVDEAHAYKALPIITRRTRVAGIPTSESDRATDMYMKTQYLTNLNGMTRGLVFATGTPVTNTMAELYNMQRYLQGKALKDAGIDHFDAWANTFGDVRTGIELDVSGKGFRENTRFAKFINIPELIKMYMGVADVKTADMLKLPRPDLETGGYIAIAGASSPELEAYIDHLVDRSEEIRGGNVDKKVDNMLKVVSEGKKAALDMRLVDPQASDRPTSKVNRAVTNIARIHHSSTDQRATQIVFCDLSVPLSAKKKKKNKAAVPADVEAEDDLTAVPEAAGEIAGFSVYDDMRRKLINAGVPPKEIAFIHDYDSDEAKQDLFDSVRAGRVRILFGSTEKMGVGTNVQARMLALHNMDAPWRPADIMQRVGRIQRQGNMHKTVQVYQYLTEGSFDAYSWQLLENKAAFIAPILAGDVTIREMEDVGMMLPSAAEFKAMASGNPIIKEKIGTDSQLAKLAAQRSAFQRQQLGIRHEMAGLPGRISDLEDSLSEQKKEVKFIEEHKDDGFEIDGNKFAGDDARKNAAEKLHEVLLGLTGKTTKRIIGHYNGFRLTTEPAMYDPNSAWAQTEEGQKAMYPGMTITGPLTTRYINVNRERPMSTIQSMEAIVRGIGVSDWTANDLADAKAKLAQLAPLLDRTWPHEKQYADLTKRKAQIDAQLDQSEAEKSAGSEDGDATTQKIPKGTSYQARKHILLARERGENVEYESPVETARATPPPQQAKINKVPTVKPTKDSGPMSAYRASNEEIPAPARGWYKQEIDGQTYHSNGSFILQGQPPEGETYPDAFDMKPFLAVPDGSSEVTPRAYWINTSRRGVKTKLVGFSPDTAIPADNYDYVKKAFPDALFFSNPKETRQVLVKSDGKLVGLVMGIQEPEPPERLEDVLAAPETRPSEGPISDYRPTGQPLAAPQGGWLQETTPDGRTYYSDDALTLEGPAPSAEISGKKPAIAEFVAAGENGTPVQARAFSEAGNVPLVWFKPNLAIESKYYDQALKAFPDATFTASVAGNQPLVFIRAGGRVVGAIVPFTGQQPPRQIMPILKPGEAGTLNLGPLVDVAKDVGTFLKEDVAPAGKAVITKAASMRQAIQHAFAPQTIDSGAKITAGRLRAMFGRQMLANDRAKAAFEAFKLNFYKQPMDLGVYAMHVIDAIEDPTGTLLLSLDPVAANYVRAVRAEYDSRWNRLNKLGRLNNYLQNYYTHLYKDPKKAEQFVATWQARRPLPGAERFRKKRVFPTFREAITPKAQGGGGLEPAFDNPVDYLLAGLAQMDKAITAHEFFDEMKPDLKFSRGAPPDGYEQVDDKIFTVNGPRFGAVRVPGSANVEPGDVEVFGHRTMGHWYAPAGMAAVINNHLGPSIRDTGARALFDTWIAAKGAMNALNLGFSAFHATTTVYNSAISELALAMKQAAGPSRSTTLSVKTASGNVSITKKQSIAGRLGKASATATKSLLFPLPFIRGQLRGKRLIAAWDGTLKNATPQEMEVVQALKEAGGSPHQASFNERMFRDGLRRAWAQKKYTKAGVRVLNPLLWAEATTAPIAARMVPRAKMAAFMNAILVEIQQHPNMGTEEQRDRFGRIWDSMDNRFGQLNQRNMLMNKEINDIMNAVVGRPGWTLGTLREMLGGTYDLGKAAVDGGRGKPPEFSWRSAGALSILIYGAFLSGLMTAIMTHEMPHGIDYIDPRTGGVTEDGHPARLIMPGYLSRDIHSWLTAPGDTAKAKLAQPLMVLADLTQNRDHYHHKIFGPDGIGLRQYMTNLILPYSATGIMRNRERGEGVAKTLLPMVGIQPAPKSVGLSQAEEMVAKWHEEQRSDVRPPSSQRNRAQSQIFILAKKGDFRGAQQKGEEAVAAGQMSHKDVRNTITRARTNPLLADYKTVTDLRSAMRIYEAATPEEKILLQREANDKARRAQAKPWLWNNSDGAPDKQTRAIASKYFKVIPFTTAR